MADMTKQRAGIIYFVEDFNLYVGVVDNEIFRIQKNDSNPRIINPHAVIVRSFDATFDEIHVEDNRLYLDGFALTALMLWLSHQLPNAHFKTFARRLFKFFPGSVHCSDLMRATIRCATGAEYNAYGESAYFCAKVRNAHPDEFDDLATAWKSHPQNPQRHN